MPKYEKIIKTLAQTLNEMLLYDSTQFVDTLLGVYTYSLNSNIFKK